MFYGQGGRNVSWTTNDRGKLNRARRKNSVLVEKQQRERRRGRRVRRKGGTSDETIIMIIIINAIRDTDRVGIIKRIEI